MNFLTWAIGKISPSKVDTKKAVIHEWMTARDKKFWV